MGGKRAQKDGSKTGQGEKEKEKERKGGMEEGTDFRVYFHEKVHHLRLLHPLLPAQKVTEEGRREGERNEKREGQSEGERRTEGRREGWRDGGIVKRRVRRGRGESVRCEEHLFIFPVSLCHCLSPSLLPT